jgi:uncharacterized protein YxjI
MNLQDYTSLALRQRVTLLINRYEYYGRDGETEQLLAFAEQKRFKLKEEITAWADESRATVVFAMKAKQVLDVSGQQMVSDGDGQPLGYLRKAFGRSLWRSTWEVYDAADQLQFTAQERNATIAVVRRLGQLVPVVGDILSQLPFNFVFRRNDQEVGSHKRLFGWRDHYDITLAPELAQVDRRLVMALGIALDALQAR